MIYVINSARYSVSSHILRDHENNFPVMLICDECHRCKSAGPSQATGGFRKPNAAPIWRKAAKREKKIIG
jgi:hypothetical protein